MSNTRNQWRQLSMRGAVLAITVLCVLFALLGAELRRAKRQAQAVAKLEECGAVVTYDDEVDASGNFIDVPDTFARRLRRFFFGKDFGTNVTKISFAAFGKRLDSDCVQAIAQMTELKSLDVQVTNVSGQDLQQFSHLTQLESLNLGHLALVDEDLRVLEGMKKLQWVNLSHTQITSKGLSSLKHLSALKCILASDTQVGDDGLKHLERLPNLLHVFAKNTQVSEQAADQFSKANNCDVVVQ